MNTLSGSELFRSPFDISRDDLRELIGNGVSLLAARSDNCLFEGGGGGARIGACALAMFEVLDEAERSAEARRGTPDFHPDHDFIDLRTLPASLLTHRGLPIDIGRDTDARELVELVSDLALQNPSERPTIPLIARDEMPHYERLPLQD